MAEAVYLDTSGLNNPGGVLPVKFAVINASSSGDNTIVPAVSDVKIRVVHYVFTVASDVNVRWESSAGGTALSGVMSFTAGVQSAFSPVGLFETISGELLNLELSGAVQVSGHLAYVEVPA